MKKSDLKSGMILETRRGKRYLLTNGAMRTFDGSGGFANLFDFNDDLTCKYTAEWDIIKVYNFFALKDIFKDENLTLLWEREEIELTDREVEVLKALKTLGFKWIARDKDGDLCAFSTKPHKFNSQWNTVSDVAPLLVYFGFDFIKWSDEEPTKIDDLLKELKE